MSKAAYPLKLPASVKTAAARLAKAIAVAVAEKVGVPVLSEKALARNLKVGAPEQRQLEPSDQLAAAD